MRLWVGGWLILMVALAGCTSMDQSINNLAESLNTRQGQGCYAISGLYGPFVSLNAILATGGATIESCRGQGTLGVIRTVPATPAPQQCTTVCE